MSRSDAWLIDEKGDFSCWKSQILDGRENLIRRVRVFESLQDEDDWLVSRFGVRVEADFLTFQLFRDGLFVFR